MKIGSVIEILVEKNIVSREELQGCNDEEIQIVQEFAGKPLPKSYIEFLKIMGHGAGQYLDECYVFFEDIEKIVNFYKELYSGTNYPESFFIFSTYHFESEVYFRFDDGGDPPVYLNMDVGELGERQLSELDITKYNNLAAYLYDMIEVYE